jgi:Ca-activated chloride channel family protein
LSAAVGLLAQETIFRSKVRLVRLFVTVKDKSGAPVGTLEKSDFQVFDNGVEQTIMVFERDTELPLSVAVLVDTSGSTAKELKSELDSVHRFLRAFLHEGNAEDRAAIYSFNWQVTQQSGFTRSLDRLEASIRRLKPEGGTSLYDAIYLASHQMEDREGRHAMIVVTDGGDTTSNKNFHQALEAAHLADSVLYPIVIIPITNEAGRNIGGENALTTLAQGTGGRIFSPNIGDELDAAFSEILRDLRTQYLVGYYPRNIPPTKNRFHTVRVNVKRPGLQVSTRNGYYGDSDDLALATGTHDNADTPRLSPIENKGPGGDVHGAEVSPAAHRRESPGADKAQR